MRKYTFERNFVFFSQVFKVFTERDLDDWFESLLSDLGDHFVFSLYFTSDLFPFVFQFFILNFSFFLLFFLLICHLFKIFFQFINSFQVEILKLFLGCLSFLLGLFNLLFVGVLLLLCSFFLFYPLLQFMVVSLLLLFFLFLLFLHLLFFFLFLLKLLLTPLHDLSFNFLEIFSYTQGFSDFFHWNLLERLYLAMRRTSFLLYFTRFIQKFKLIQRRHSFFILIPDFCQYSFKN